MRTITSASRSFGAAGHENPFSPGVLKKVLLEKADLRPGQIQMVNWASLGVGKQFVRHYHEDMQELFILMQGEAELTVGMETATLRRGDAVVIDLLEPFRIDGQTARMLVKKLEAVRRFVDDSLIQPLRRGRLLVRILGTLDRQQGTGQEQDG